ncbi:MAG: 30S ribosomal protein S12 methylthiotransferase RimO [Firmicutes bacterium]|nr:30S ribosomal protein S12 methylthiotransferase RimO [Candidatus Fermentithermobacillaceae bacterium]
MGNEGRISGQPDKTKCCIAVYGCAKNQVDAEEMASRLIAAGYEVTGDVSQAGVVIVHTCGFIEDAKRESIQGIFHAIEAAGNRPDGSTPVIVTGCLSQRYPDELLKEIPEIAGVAGTAAPRDIVEIVGKVLERKGRARPGEGEPRTATAASRQKGPGDSVSPSDRRVRHVGEPGRGAPGGEGSLRFDPYLTKPWAYLRVAEGCRHHCTYCAIPSIRGPLRSRPEDEILAEARHLSSLGVVEINLIAQDLSDYGFDREGKRCLARLVRRLSSVPGIRWIRLLYVRPDGVDNELAEAMALPNVAPYVDLPIEHGSQRILRLMGRPGPREILKAVELLKSKIPDLYLRTTVITGFPGETEKDVLDTMDLLCAIGAHRVGVFPFSREEGTAAYNLPAPVPENVARERAEAIRRQGLRLASESGATMTGKEIDVILERPSSRPGYWIGRGPHQAPEVDGVTYVKTQSDGEGSMVRARVTSSGILTLFAQETPV